MRQPASLAVAALCGLLLVASPALAGSNAFPNKDTATDRRDNTFGTEKGPDSGQTVIGTDEAGDAVIKSSPPPKKEPVDWYDKVIITVDPDVSWPQDKDAGQPETTPAQ